MQLEGKSLKRDFLKFIVPAIAAQWVFALYTMVDGMFVAKGVSETALAAVNLSFPFVAGLFSLSLLFAVGTSTVIAILFGQKKMERANRVFTQNVAVLSVLSVLVTVLVLTNLERFGRFLGATELTLPYVSDYIRTLAPFAICFILSYSFEILISTDGYPSRATVIVTLGVVLNCVLDYLMVFVWKKGVAGAALATGISQAVVILLYLGHFLGKKGTIHFTKFKMDYPLLWREFKNGLPSGVTELSSGIIIFLFNQAILQYIGEEALVSYTIISYVNSIVVMSMTGVAQGCQPLISYYHGKRMEPVCAKLLRYEVAAVLVLTVAALAVSFGGAPWLVSLFISQEMTALREYSVRVFQIFGLSYLVVGYNVILGGYFTAIEQPVQAIVISFARGLVVLAVSLKIMTALFGGEGIWWSALLSEMLCLILSVCLFFMYKKGQKKVFQKK